MCDEQWVYRRGKGCVDQIFVIQMLVEEYLEKGKKLHVAFMNLDKAYVKG